MLHANLTALSFTEPELWLIKVLVESVVVVTCNQTLFVGTA